MGNATKVTLRSAALLGISSLLLFFALNHMLSAKTLFCHGAARMDWLSTVEVERIVTNRQLKLISISTTENRCLQAVASDSVRNLHKLTINPVNGTVMDQELVTAKP